LLIKRKMCKIFVTFVTFFLLTTPCYAMWPFDPKVGLKLFNKTKTELKAGINDNKTTLDNVTTKIGVLEGNIAQAQVGIKNMQAGGDINITENPKVLQGVIASLIAIIMYLLRGSRATKKWLQNALTSKERWKSIAEDKK